MATMQNHVMGHNFWNIERVLEHNFGVHTHVLGMKNIEFFNDILFYSNGLAIWHSFPDIMHVSQ